MAGNHRCILPGYGTVHRWDMRLLMVYGRCCFTHLRPYKLIDLAMDWSSPCGHWYLADVDRCSFRHC